MLARCLKSLTARLAKRLTKIHGSNSSGNDTKQETNNGGLVVGRVEHQLIGATEKIERLGNLEFQKFFVVSTAVVRTCSSSWSTGRLALRSDQRAPALCILGSLENWRRAATLRDAVRTNVVVARIMVSFLFCCYHDEMPIRIAKKVKTTHQKKGGFRRI